MKNQLRSLTLVTILICIVVLGVIQLRIPVVRANECGSCPTTTTGGCVLVGCTTVTIDGTTYTDCYYECLRGDEPTPPPLPTDKTKPPVT